MQVFQEEFKFSFISVNHMKIFFQYISYLGQSFIVYRMPRATVDVKHYFWL